MATTITQTTINTGSNTFSDPDDFNNFLNNFSVIQKFAVKLTGMRISGDVLDYTVAQQAPNIFVFTRTLINEAAENELLNSFSLEDFQNICTQMHWTVERNVSYRY